MFRRLGPFIPVLKFLALATVLFFVGRALWRDLAGVDDWRAFRPHWLWVAASVVALAGVSGVQLLSYRFLLRAFGHRLGWREMVPVAWIPPLGKYVPGKVFALLGAMAMLRRAGVPAATGVGVVLMMDALAVMTGLMTGAPILFRHSTLGAAVAAACVVFGLGALHPAIFVGSLNRLLKLIGKPPVPHTPTLGQYAVPLACAFSQWLFAGVSLWCMTRAFGAVHVDAVPTLVCVQACAMTLGYLAIIAPGGIGVTDGIRLVVLKSLLPDLPDASIAFIVIAMRVLQSLLDLSLALIASAMRK
jgi:glycosyltransferase 2 family protein